MENWGSHRCCKFGVESQTLSSNWMTEHLNKPFGIFFLPEIDGKHPTIVGGKEPSSSLLIHISNKNGNICRETSTATVLRSFNFEYMKDFFQYMLFLLSPLGVFCDEIFSSCTISLCLYDRGYSVSSSHSTLLM